MPVLFPSTIGAVVQLNDDAAQCQVGYKISPDIEFGSENSIITRLTVSQQANVQFLHTLGSLIYVYVFGDRMGQVGLSGLAFGCPCPSGSTMGADQMLKWYSTNRVSKKKDPVTVTIGQTAIEGFVIGFSEDVVDPSTGLVQWNVNLASLPESSGGGGGGGGAAGVANIKG